MNNDENLWDEPLVARGEGVQMALQKIEEARRTQEALALDLGSLGLTSADLGLLMPSIQKLPGLEALDLHGNNIHDLPEAIWDLSTLKELDLSQNFELKIPKNSIRKLTHLEKLDLSLVWGLSEIPTDIWSLSQLKVLAMSNIPFCEIPDQIEALTALEELDLSFTNISKISPKIGKLERLKKLDLRNNSNLEILGNIGDLREPECLDRSNYVLVDRAVDELIRLPKNLNLQINLDLLPAILADKLIYHFDIFESQRTEQNALHQMLIDLGESQKFRIGRALDNIRKAKHQDPPSVDLSFMELTSDDLALLTPFIAEIPHLEILDLRNNILTYIPPGIMQLGSLTELSLSNNQEIQIPESISNLKALEELHLSSAGVQKIPKCIGNLSELRVLDIRKNPRIQIPIDISKLQKLEELYLSHCQLATVPSGIGNVNDLQVLDLAHNELTEIPASLGDLRGLHTLNLRGNASLRSLPDSIVQLPSSLGFSIDLEQLLPRVSNALVGHFDTIAMERSQESEHMYCSCKRIIEQLYPSKNSKKLWSRIEQMDSGDFEVQGPTGKMSFSAPRVLKEFLERLPVGEAFAAEVYNPIAKKLLDAVLAPDYTAVQKKNALHTMAAALGECSTPVKRLLTQLYIGEIIDNQGDIPKKGYDLMVGMALERCIRTALSDFLKGPEAAEEIAALLHCLFLRDQPEWKDRPIPIAGLDQFPVLPRFSKYIDFGFLQLKSNVSKEALFQQFVRLCCKTTDQDQLVQIGDQYQADSGKINAIIEDFFAIHGMVSLREQAVQDYGAALQALLQCQDHLLAYHYEAADVISQTDIQQQQQDFRRQLQEVPDTDIDKTLGLKLAQAYENISKLGKKYSQEKHALSAFAKISEGLVRLPPLDADAPTGSKEVNPTTTISNHKKMLIPSI